MSQLPALDTTREQWWSGFFRRCTWAVRAFRAPTVSPMIALTNGMILNLENGTVIVDGDLTIHSTGTLKFSADKHLIIESGQGPEDRPGYVHSVWLNPEYDNEGRPVEDPGVLEIEEFGHGDESSD